MNNKWYELIEGDDNRVEKPLIVNEENLGGFDYVDLKFGDRIDDWDARSCFRSSGSGTDGTPDDFLANAFGIPIVSSELRNALALAGVATQEIQFLPVQILQSNGENVRDFAIANVITRLPALDLERSTMLEVDEEEIDLLTGLPRIRSIWTAALKRELVASHDIIRLKEFFPPIFVSQRFADVFATGNFTGATLKPVPVYGTSDLDW